MVFNERLHGSISNVPKIAEVHFLHKLKLATKIWKTNNGLIKVDLEFSFTIPGLFQTWNSNKPGLEKLNSRSELELIKKTVIN